MQYPLSVHHSVKLHSAVMIIDMIIREEHRDIDLEITFPAITLNSPLAGTTETEKSNGMIKSLAVRFSISRSFHILFSIHNIIIII